MTYLVHWEQPASWRETKRVFKVVVHLCIHVHERVCVERVRERDGRCAGVLFCIAATTVGLSALSSMRVWVTKIHWNSTEAIAELWEQRSACMPCAGLLSVWIHAPWIKPHGFSVLYTLEHAPNDTCWRFNSSPTTCADDYYKLNIAKTKELTPILSRLLDSLIFDIISISQMVEINDGTVS